MKKFLIAAFSLLLVAGSVSAQGPGKKMGHRKHHRAAAWQTDPDGRMWRMNRKGNKVWRGEKRKRSINPAGRPNNGRGNLRY